MRWTALVPLKPPGRRKTRLAGFLSIDARDRLSELMFEHVTLLLERQRQIGRVIALAAERPPGWSGPLVIDRGRGLNVELESARVAIGVGPLLILHSDLPLLQMGDIAALLTAAPSVAPDRHGRGTNALALQSGSVLRFRFGPGSFRRHCAGLPGARVMRRAGLGLDIDSVTDLFRAIAAGFEKGGEFLSEPSRRRFHKIETYLSS